MEISSPSWTTESGAAHLELALLVVHANRVAADHRRQAQAARHHRRVAARAATTGQDALGHQHAVDVVGAGLLAHQNNALASFAGGLGAVGVEDRFADRRAWRGVDAAGPARASRLRPALCASVEARQQELHHLSGLDALDRLLLADQPLADHVHRDLDRRGGRALGRARLEHVEVARARW